MADTHSGASVVAVDPQAQAELRNRLAHEELARAMSPNLTLVSLSGIAYTVPYHIQVVAKTDSVAERSKIQAIIDHCFHLCDRHLNEFNPKSEVSLINAAPVGKPVALSPILTTVLSTAFALSRMTNGVFDVAVGPLHAHLSDFVKRHGRMPSSHPGSPEQGAVCEVAKLATFDASWTLAMGGPTVAVSAPLTGTSATITKKHPAARLVLGGISKGYTVDLIIAELERKGGYQHALVSWGGDTRAVGRNHKEDLWKVGVVVPPSVEQLTQRGEGGLKKPAAGGGGDPPGGDHNDTAAAAATTTMPYHYIAVIGLDNEALCTSGDYENFIIIPQSAGSAPTTLAAAPLRLFTNTVCTEKLVLISPSDNAIAQASVVASSCLVADALATAALVKVEVARARGLLERFRYTRDRVSDFLIYTRNGARVARMHEVASETAQMRHERIEQSLPSRVIIVGGGLAGCCAAIEAASCGAHVVLLEKTSTLGGNSAKATSGINGWGTRPQALKGVADDGKFFERDTYFSGVGGRCDTGLVSTLSVKSSDAIHWLMKTTKLQLTTLFQLGGHSRPRTHRVPDAADGKPVPVGYTIMQALGKVIREQYGRKITVLTDASVLSLAHTTFTEPGDVTRARVHGVEYVDTKTRAKQTLTADAVVLCTGGFCNDHSDTSLLREFTPHLETIATTNGPFATGDGVKMARAIGATLVDMDKVQLHPTGFVNPKDPANPTKFLGPEALRGSGGLLINQHGKRFVNELDLRSKVSSAINDQKLPYPAAKCNVAYCVLNGAAIKLFGTGQLGFYKDKIGLFKDVANVEELAAHIQCPVEVLSQTLTEYEASCKEGKCPTTGKSVFPSVIGPQGPFVVAIVTPVLHYSMGGVAISPSTEVQVEDSGAANNFGHRKPVLGLFAAGEVSAGVHGGNRLGGNSLLECVVFGRIAGDRAATILQPRDNALSSTEWRAVTVREVREGEEFGHGSKIIRFNLPGALQKTGLKIGQFVGIRGEWDGQPLQGFYSPLTLPNDYGVIGLLVRSDKGVLKEFINALKPGSAVHMKACGGLSIDRLPSSKQLAVRGRVVRRIGLIAGGTGIAPMIQIIRGALKKPYVDDLVSLHLIYAAESYDELTYSNVLKHFVATSHGKFAVHFVVNTPPAGWTEGVGFVDADMLRGHMPAPATDALVVLCGPPVMQRALISLLVSVGHARGHVRTVDEADVPTAPAKL